MARKTHRPDDIMWTVTAADIDAARSEKQDVTLGEVLDIKYPRKSLVKLFEEKLIHINGHKATPKDVISEGDEIWIAMAKEKIDHEPIEMNLHILYEDDDLSLCLSCLFCSFFILFFRSKDLYFSFVELVDRN